MEVILFQPEIPQNAGNVVRTCAVTGTNLSLVRPLGFSTASRHMKRAGLDYWDEVNVDIVDSLEEKLTKEGLTSPFYFFSSKAEKFYTTCPFDKDAKLIFGSETKGLPPHFFEKWPELFYKIPMKTGLRCLNLANAVSIVLYEAYRQQGFDFT